MIGSMTGSMTVVRVKWRLRPNPSDCQTKHFITTLVIRLFTYYFIWFLSPNKSYLTQLMWILSAVDNELILYFSLLSAIDPSSGHSLISIPNVTRIADNANHQMRAYNRWDGGRGRGIVHPIREGTVQPRRHLPPGDWPTVTRVEVRT